MSEAQPGTLTCHSCGLAVPAGEFCGACGAQLAQPGKGGRARLHAYAANPAEHVVHLALVSTLLPHLPHRRSAPFRVGLAALTVLLAAFGLLRLTAPAIGLAAAAMPVLYLLYLYEVEVYESQPALVLGLTLALGAALGAVWAWFAGPLLTQADLASLILAPSPDRILLAGVALPAGAQLLMLVGPALLSLLGRFDETLDGFAFGAASALGFSLAVTLVELRPELAAGQLSELPASLNALQILQRGLLVPVINASATGLVAAALWLARGRRRSSAAHPLATLPAAVAIALVLQAALGVAALQLADATLQVAAYALAVGLLLLLVRLALHRMLLAEAVEGTAGETAPCSHCHRLVPRMAFCPHCGIATRATPKAGQGRLAREVR